MWGWSGLEQCGGGVVVGLAMLDWVSFILFTKSPCMMMRVEDNFMLIIYLRPSKTAIESL